MLQESVKLPSFENPGLTSYLQPGRIPIAALLNGTSQ